MCIHHNSGTSLLRTLKCEHLISKDTASANKTYSIVCLMLWVSCTCMYTFKTVLEFCTQVNNQLDTDMLSAKPLQASSLR